MSLTSYRAAPPRDKPLRAFEKPNRKRIWPTPGGADWSGPQVPEKATPSKARGCERYVPTRAGFGKGCGQSFRDFIVVRNAALSSQIGPNRRALARKSAKAQALGGTQRAGA